MKLQVPRQMIPQMQQLMSSHGLQQHLEHMRRRQASAPRPVMDFDKSRPMVQVKIENPSDLPIDGNAFNNAVNMRHPQMQQYRQQQMAAMSNLHPQHNNQFRPMSAFQISQMQAQ